MQQRETLSELAEKYEIHPNQITCWKKKFLERAPQIFEKHVSEKKEDTDLDKLYAEIGLLEIEREFLKNLKKLGL